MTQEFIKTRSSLDIIISSATLLTGGLLSFIPENVSLQITGYLLLVIGLLLFLTFKSLYRNVASRDLFRKKVKFFDIAHKSVILDSLKNDPEKIDMKLEGKGSGVLLDIFYNDKDVYIQVYLFASGQYEANGEMIHFPSSKVKKLVD